MSDSVVLLVLPGLRQFDLERMPQLRGLLRGGDLAALAPGFPCLSGPVQAGILTGATPDKHGVIGDEFYLRSHRQIVRRGSPAFALGQPAIWDVLRQYDPQAVTADWLSPLASQSGANLACMATGGAWRLRPQALQNELQTVAGQSRGDSDWNAPIEAAIETARRHRPEFFYLCSDDLARVAEQFGPDSEDLQAALAGLDEGIARLITGFGEAYGESRPLWLVTGAFSVSSAEGPLFPNRYLHETGLLKLQETPEGQAIDFKRSQAWAVVNRQVAHVYVADGSQQLVAQTAELFQRRHGIADVLGREEIERFGIFHEHTGDLVLVSAPNCWFAYPWWSNDGAAPAWSPAPGSRRQPGIDPSDAWRQTGASPLAAAADVRGSYGAPARDESQRSFIASSEPGVLAGAVLADTDVFDLVLRQFGV